MIPGSNTEQAEAFQLLPNVTSDRLRRIDRRQRVVDLAIIAALLVNALLLCLISTNYLNTLVGIIGNLIASGIVAMIVVISRWRT
jgi:dCTP deaminase